MKTINQLIPYGGGSQKPDRIVVHSMGEYVQGNDDRFLHASAFLADYKLSTHILVTPDGDLIRCHKDNEIAWHAKRFNTNSLGIAFLVSGEHNYVTFINAIKEQYLTGVQYAAGIEMVNHWQRLYDIKSVDRHSDLSPNRKVDPGEGFPWEDFKERIAL